MLVCGSRGLFTFHLSNTLFRSYSYIMFCYVRRRFVFAILIVYVLLCDIYSGLDFRREDGVSASSCLDDMC